MLSISEEMRLSPLIRQVPVKVLSLLGCVVQISGFLIELTGDWVSISLRSVVRVIHISLEVVSPSLHMVWVRGVRHVNLILSQVPRMHTSRWHITREISILKILWLSQLFIVSFGSRSELSLRSARHSCGFSSEWWATSEVVKTTVICVFHVLRSSFMLIVLGIALIFHHSKIHSVHSFVVRVMITLRWFMKRLGSCPVESNWVFISWLCNDNVLIVKVILSSHRWLRQWFGSLKLLHVMCSVFWEFLMLKHVSFFFTNGRSIDESIKWSPIPLGSDKLFKWL